MKYISLFSGIGGFDEAFRRAGMECDSVCEIDKSAQAILTRHFPEAKLFDDVKKVGKETHERKSIDVICGGFPCQDVSVAGKRAGLAGERSGLWFEFARIIDELEPGWVVIENVPGLLSSNKGKDFAVIVQWLAERGYGVCWRVLDAQYFGVPQRRRRVFIVASFGNGRAAEVLFERESVSGYIAQGGEAGQDASLALNVGTGKRLNATDTTFAISGIAEYKQQLGTLRAQGGDLGGGSEILVTPTLHTGLGHHGWSVGDQDWNLLQPVAATFQSGGRGGVPSSRGENIVAFSTKDDGRGMAVDVSPTIQSQHTGIGVWEMSHASEAVRESGDIVPTLQSRMGTGGNQVPMVGVRRLTPTECERLQGFPDGWTDGQSDSARYRQLGNAAAIPVVEWIAKRIVKAEARTTQREPDGGKSAKK